MPGKPSDRGQFGFPAETGAAPITGAPAAHCLRLLRQDLENLAGSDQKHHGYVLVLDCTVADEFVEPGLEEFKISLKALIMKDKIYFLLLSPVLYIECLYTNCIYLNRAINPDST